MRDEIKKCQTIIRAGNIITQNEKREIVENGGIAIANGKICEIGPYSEIRKIWQAAEELDLGDQLVMPGLVNSHTHAAMTFLRGLADDLPLMDWLEKSVFPVEARLTPEIVKLGSLLGYAEMLATGTTACIDMYIFEDAVFSAAEVAGIRCMGGEAIFSFPSAACVNWRDALARTEDMARRYSGNSRIKVAVNPHSVYTTDAEILAACRDLALELDLPVHIHLAETTAETEKCRQQNGMRPVDWLNYNGLLDTRLIAAHLVDINREEAGLLAKSGAIGAHNPSSNMKLASGASPVDMMRNQGLTVALGTDGPASNNTLNMFVEMGRAALLHKHASGDPASLPADKVLDMATINGGKANFFTGSLETGKPADLIALDLSSPHMQPMHNPVSQVVYAASGHECRMTMVEGEILYRDGKFTRFDYPILLDEARKLRDFALGKTI